MPVGGGGERQTPARRGSRERRGGPGRALAGPGDPTAPVPPAARTPDRATHPRGPRGSRRVAATAREARGGGGVVRRGGGRRAALLSPSSIPPGPGHTGDGRRAPSASVRPPAPERGGGRRAARTRRPARGGARPGTRPALGRAHRGGGAPSSGTRRRRRRRRRRHGRRIGAAAGPGSEAHQGTRPRGAADGEGTEADGRAERGTDGMRPRGADTAQPAAGVGWPRATARGTAQSEPGEGTRVGRRGPPRDLTATGPPGTGAVPRRHPRRRTGAPTLAGLAATATATPGAAAGPGRTLSRRTPAAPPPRPSRARGSPAPPPSLRAFRGHCTAPPGDATGPAGAGGRHPREGEARPARARAGDGNAGGRTRGTRRGEARPAAAGRGRRARTAGAAGQGRGRRPGTGGKRPGHAAGPPGTPARDPTATRTRGRSRDARGAGRPRPSPERGPRPGPAARAGEPSTRLPPSIRHRSVFRLSLNPEARPPGDDALERGGPDRDRTPPPAAAQGARAGATGSPSPTAAGPGKPRPTGRRAPTRPPLSPRAHPTGAGRTHTAPHLPDARRGPAGPSPDSEGGGAGRGRQRAARGPTAGPAHPTPSPPAEGGGVLLCPRAPAVATVATAALGRGGGWGVRYPKAPSRIAREGVLTEGAPSLPRTVSPSGSRRRSTSRPASAGREGSAVQGSGPPHRSVCAVRARAEPASRPLQGLIRRGLRDEGNGHASPFRLDPPERQPRSGHTRHRGGDPRGTPG